MQLSVGQMMPFLPDALKDVNIGFLALAVNVIVFVAVSAVTQPQSGRSRRTRRCIEPTARRLTREGAVRFEATAPFCFAMLLALPPISLRPCTAPLEVKSTHE